MGGKKEIFKEIETEHWEIDWKALAGEFTWEKLWKKRDWKSIWKHFLVAFSTGFFFSAFDVITDGTSGFTFIFGAYYIKNVELKSDSSVEHFMCNITGRFTEIDQDGSEQVDYYRYQCFEKDPIWGFFTLAFMFVPGLPGLLADKLWGGMREQDFIGKNKYELLRILTIPLFPIIVIGTKTARLLNDGPEMKKLAARVVDREGRFESTLQFGLQLFIVLSRKDRLPSTLQWVTIATSFVMLNKAGLESYLMYDKKSKDLKAGVQKVAALLPMFFFANAFKLGSGALLAVILHYGLIPGYAAACFLGTPLFFWKQRGRRERNLYCQAFFLHPIAIFRAPPTLLKRRYTEKERTRQLLYGNVVWFVNTSILLISGSIMMASTKPTSRLTTIFSNTGLTLTYKILLPGILACGLISLGLIYWEYASAKNTIDREKEEQSETGIARGTEFRIQFEEQGSQTEKGSGLGGRFNVF